MSQPSYPYVVTIATPGPRGPQQKSNLIMEEHLEEILILLMI